MRWVYLLLSYLVPVVTVFANSFIVNAWFTPNEINAEVFSYPISKVVYAVAIISTLTAINVVVNVLYFKSLINYSRFILNVIRNMCVAGVLFLSFISFTVTLFLFDIFGRIGEIWEYLFLG